MRNGLLFLLASFHIACQSYNQFEGTHCELEERIATPGAAEAAEAASRTAFREWEAKIAKSERLATPEEVEAARAAYLEHQALVEKTKKWFEKSN